MPSEIPTLASQLLTQAGLDEPGSTGRVVNPVTGLLSMSDTLSVEAETAAAQAQEFDLDTKVLDEQERGLVGALADVSGLPELKKGKVPLGSGLGAMIGDILVSFAQSGTNRGLQLSSKFTDAAVEKSQSEADRENRRAEIEAQRAEAGRIAKISGEIDIIQGQRQRTVLERQVRQQAAQAAAVAAKDASIRAATAAMMSQADQDALAARLTHEANEGNLDRQQRASLARRQIDDITEERQRGYLATAQSIPGVADQIDEDLQLKLQEGKATPAEELFVLDLANREMIRQDPTGTLNTATLHYNQQLMRNTEAVDPNTGEPLPSEVDRVGAKHTNKKTGVINKRTALDELSQSLTELRLTYPTLDESQIQMLEQRLRLQAWNRWTETDAPARQKMASRAALEAEGSRLGASRGRTRAFVETERAAAARAGR